MYKVIYYYLTKYMYSEHNDFPITSCFTNHILHILAQNCLLDYVPHVSSHKLRHKVVNASTYYEGPSPTAEFHQELISSLSMKIWICEKVIMKKLLPNIAISKIFFFFPRPPNEMTVWKTKSEIRNKKIHIWKSCWIGEAKMQCLHIPLLCQLYL